MTGRDLSLAARGLVGTPFRFHGRDPESGLDCIGVIQEVFARCGRMVDLPRDYPLRSLRLPDLSHLLPSLGLASRLNPSMVDTAGFDARDANPGDLVMVRPAICQVHFAIAVGQGCFVHAHAGLRRVVCAPLPPSWPVLGHWHPIQQET